ncbi:MAG: phage antirepressor KilAC domain-containing protein [Flavobacteriales bacterium]|jgi:anti-repressor protein|nr:phage antirepressor KilAC domain-containing protein [Flavobacteriales bacterium]
MNEMIINEFAGTNIHTFMWNGKPCWIANEILSVFDYADSSKTIQQCIQAEEFEINIEYDVLRGLELKNFKELVNKVTTSEVVTSLKYVPQLIIFYEDGLYGFLQYTDKPIGVKFRKWLRNEVLPSIRKYGFYATDQFLENPDYAIKVFQELKEERLKNKRLEEHFHKTESFASFGRAIASSRDGILIGNYAKILKNTNVKIGQNRLFRWLRSNGYLIKNGARKNTPTQKSIDLDLLVLEEMTILTSNGSTVQLKTLVTGKGQKYFYGLLKKDFEIKDKLLFDSFDLSVLRIIKNRLVESGLTPDMMDDSTEFLELVFSYSQLIREIKAVKQFWYDI